MDRILLFIPAYNCEKQIVRVLAQLNDTLLGYIGEIIVVNNRSTDRTEEVVREYARKHTGLPLKILRNSDNYNLGGSHKVAFRYGIENAFDYVVVLHGDDQGSIGDLLPVLSDGRYRNYDCCLGARFMPGSKLWGYSRFRTFGNRVFNIIFSVALGIRIYDLGSGLNLYSTGMLRDLFYHKFPDRLTFNYCMIMAAHYYRHRMHFFPITWREADQVSNVKMTSQAFNVLGMLAKYVMRKATFIRSEMREKPVDIYSSTDVTLTDEVE